jgi:FdhD protein
VSNSRRVAVNRWSQGQGTAPGAAVEDRIATEVPVALTYNRQSHVVMMATPSDLEDFATGFSITEGIVGDVSELKSIRSIPREGGVELAVTIGEADFDRLSTRRRNLAGRTGCGLCGAETIEQALRLPDPVGHSLAVTNAALQRAIGELERRQPLQAETGASHGAAWCGKDGGILQIREDVGRHNALDKLIGGLLRAGGDRRGGFVLVSSRASYEMVYKTAAAGIELIAAVSAPTALAVEFAERTGVTLVGFARPGRHNIYSFGNRITDGDAADAGN